MIYKYKRPSYMMCIIYDIIYNIYIYSSTFPLLVRLTMLNHVIVSRYGASFACTS